MAKVMIVEDNDVMRFAFKEMVESLGHEVVADAGDAREALKYSQELKPDIILLDIVMPGSLTGIQIIDKLKQHNNLVKIIISSGSVEVEQISKAISKKGCSAILQKPFSLEELENALNTVLKPDK